MLRQTWFGCILINKRFPLPWNHHLYLARSIAAAIFTTVSVEIGGEGFVLRLLFRSYSYSQGVLPISMAIRTCGRTSMCSRTLAKGSPGIWRLPVAIWLFRWSGLAVRDPFVAKSSSEADLWSYQILASTSTGLPFLKIKCIFCLLPILLQDWFIHARFAI